MLLPFNVWQLGKYDETKRLVLANDEREARRRYTDDLRLRDSLNVVATYVSDKAGV
jgi:hypothetical protein